MRRQTGGWVWALLAVLSVAALPADLVAQRGPPVGRPGQDRAELERRVRARFGEMIRERLQLSEDDARRLGAVMESLQDERQALMREEMATRRRVEALFLEGGDDDEEARTILARMVQLRQREVALFAQETEALLEVLSPAQLLQFFGMRDQLNQRIRALRGEGRPGAGRRPGGG